MEYIELDFLDHTKEVDPDFIKLFEEVIDHQIKKNNPEKKLIRINFIL